METTKVPLVDNHAQKFSALAVRLLELSPEGLTQESIHELQQVDPTIARLMERLTLNYVRGPAGSPEEVRATVRVELAWEENAAFVDEATGDLWQRCTLRARVNTHGVDMASAATVREYASLLGALAGMLESLARDLEVPVLKLLQTRAQQDEAARLAAWKRAAEQTRSLLIGISHELYGMRAGSVRSIALDHGITPGVYPVRINRSGSQKEYEVAVSPDKLTVRRTA